jgi:hypothetical protein
MKVSTQNKKGLITILLVEGSWHEQRYDTEKTAEEFVCQKL